mmetsp:Transcript_24325/g.34847  ORF Transcript_24325/g.34847 Transcript_24325/m.34847 type:complete len:338 (+) Transcript_24325:44-1057(+)
MSRRSSRRTPKKAALSLSAGTSTGLSSLIDGNESTIASMLSVSISKNDTSSSATKTKLMEALTDCMAMNNLSAEALLARFFNVTLLRSYCEDRLDVSSKGNEATLAARIARAWSKPNFEPLPLKNDGGAGAESKASSKQSDTKKKGSSSKKADVSTKKRSGEKKDNNTQKCGDEKEESSTKKRKVWVSAETQPSEIVTVPPGQLGFTIKQYSTDYVVTDLTPSCAIQQGKLRVGDVILAIDNYEIPSETDDILKESDKSRDITIAGRVISMKAADHPKGSLLYLKEIRAPMFRIMNYSGVAEKYGEEFLEELNPPNRGKSGGRILAGALSSLSAGRK